MKRVVVFVPALLLLAGCFPENPLLPELKGRWAIEHGAKIRSALLNDSATSAAQVNTKELCRRDYVIFDKRAITLHSDGRAKPFFLAREVKRDGSRITLIGRVPIFGSDDSRIELVLRNGEIRFDDISDGRGRSIRHERFENDEARQVAVRTLGDVFRLVFDLKSCNA